MRNVSAVTLIASLAWLTGCAQPFVRFELDAGLADAGLPDAGLPDAGSSCTTGQAECSGACVDLNSDRSNCGACGTACAATESCTGGRCEAIDAGSCGVCPVPVNAPTRCSATGQCSRGPCNAGFFDFETGVFGCETSCSGVSCTGSDGGTFVLTAIPLGESGAVGQTASSGSSFGSAVQTSAQHSNFGTLGEATPPGPEQTGSAHRNRGGFKTQLERP